MYKTMDSVRPPKMAEWLLRRVFPDGGDGTSLGDFEEVFQAMTEEQGKFRARSWYWMNLLVSFYSFIVGKMVWSVTMYKNYVRVAFRNFKKYKGYTFINVCGLALGVACCLAIYMYIDYERSYDKYHADLDRIYRVAVRDMDDPDDPGSARIGGPPGLILREQYPEVEKVAHLLAVHDFVMKRGEKIFYENKRYYADTDIFSILTIPFLKGNPSTALDRPGTVVLTESLAAKYFEDEDPMGQTLQINNRDYEVTGVMEDPPANTHLKADCYISMKLIKDRYPFDEWFLANLYTYVKLRPHADVEALNRRLERFIELHGDEETRADNESHVIYYLQSVADIHLHSHLDGEPEPCTKPEYLMLFGAIGIFILLIACVNFINLSTARSTKRSREVGMRKVIGSHRGQLIRQFMSESLVITLIAVFIGVLLFERLLPFYRNVTHIPLTAGGLFTFEILMVLFGLVVIIAFVAGLYPALVLSAFHPIQVLKGTLTRGTKGSGIRKILVVIQFTLSILLTTGTVVVFQQLSFMRNEPLGFNKDQKLVIPLRGPVRIDKNYDLIKTAFKQHAGVSGATASSLVPGQQEGRWYAEVVGDEDTEAQVLNFHHVDPDYLSEYGLKLVTGRFFDDQMKTDMGKSYVINMAAVKAFGWASAEEALTKKLSVFQEGDIIGVVDDYHYKGLQFAIEPMAFLWTPNRFDNITLTVDTKNLDDVMDYIRATWTEFFPDHPFDYFFLDESFDQQYRAEDRISKILGGFTFLGIFISCLGLYGLASFTAEQKTKEIGIRKVLGATVPGIIGLLTKEFMKWVLIANIIAWPIAYFAAKEWLQNFAYRMDIHLAIFLISAGLVVGIAMFTVSYQAVKAGLADPVDSIRYE
jgi:putative ABC transport system permease protein